MMNAQEINLWVANDTNPPNNVAQQYLDPGILNAVLDSWDDCNTFQNCENANLIAPFIRFRLASSINSNHSTQNNIFYIGDEIDFMRFLRGIINEYLTGSSFSANISPTLLIFDPQTNYYNILYASTNFFLFNSSFQINNPQSLSSFLMNVASTNLYQKLQESRTKLSSKYDNFNLIIVSLLVR